MEDKTETFDLILDELEREFDSMKWIKYTRKNVSAAPCYSMTFGEVIRPYHGRCLSACNRKFPKVYALLQQLSARLQFTHSSYTVNKNLECLPHRDKNNVGDSIILSLGKFTGGELNIEGKLYDIYRRPLRFNGAASTHSTEKFEGNRYSIVLYNIRKERKCPPFM